MDIIARALALGARLGAAALGYSTGAGSAVIQQTNKATAVTINALSGTITTNNAALTSGSLQAFTVNNSLVAATDVIVLNLASGPAGVNSYRYIVTAVANGSFTITIENRTAGTLSEALVFNFAVIKAVAA
jgi:hypothetical protein